jgi:hypothetical protein
MPGSGSVSQRYGSADPDTYQNVTDPQHCRELYNSAWQVWSHTKNTVKPYLSKKGGHKEKKSSVCGRKTVCAGRPVAAAEGGGPQAWTKYL